MGKASDVKHQREPSTFPFYSHLQLWECIRIALPNKECFKYLTLFIVFIVSSPNLVVASMLAEGDCDTVKYLGGIPSYQNNLFSNFSIPSNCRAVSYSNPMLPRLYLQEYDYDTDSWSTVSGPITPPAYYFAGVSHGIYRLYVEIPTIYLVHGCGEFEAGPILIYNFLGQWIGYAGGWQGGTTSEYFSNSVIVGPTDEDDIKYFFVDDPETGSEAAYDDGEQVTMDISECRNFNLWWLAIFEDGPTYNRYHGNGWTTSIPTSIDLSEFWNHQVGWEFEPLHTYTVQFAIENQDCINSSWNNLDRTFFICPSGSGCRLSGRAEEVSIFPNPASQQIEFRNLLPSLYGEYTLRAFDAIGQIVEKRVITSPTVDISEWPSGLMTVVLTQDQEQIHVSKVLVLH